LDVLLGGAELERNALGRQQADDVEQKARRQHDGALADDLRLEWNPQSDVHIGRLELTAVGRCAKLNARQRLDRTARRRDSAHGLELSKQSLAVAGDLHDEYLRWDLEVIGDVSVLTNRRSACNDGGFTGVQRNQQVCQEG